MNFTAQNFQFVGSNEDAKGARASHEKFPTNESILHKLESIFEHNYERNLMEICIIKILLVICGMAQRCGEQM